MYWQKFFREHKDIHEAISTALATRTIQTGETFFPLPKDVYKAFDLTERTENCRVVILGQDPYINEVSIPFPPPTRGMQIVPEAMGLSFSVPKGVKIPPSLRNIYKELKNDLGLPIPKHGDLTTWANQGVLLLNSCLTVAKGKSGSHFDVGWEMLTDEVIKVLSDEGKKVFLLWGLKAQEKEKLIDTKNNLVLKAAHPSPFAANRGFFGCKHFSKTNQYLESIGEKPIDWSIDE